MIRRTSIMLVTLIILSFLPSVIQQSGADILPRIRCRFSKMTYYYGEDVKFYLDVDIFPETSVSELYLEESRPDGSTNRVEFGVLGEGNYEFIISKASSPAGYRECILVSKREDQVGYSEVMRWKGGYMVQESPTKPVTPTSPPPYTTFPTTIMTETTAKTTNQQYLDQSFLPIFAILVILVIAAILVRNLRSRDQGKSKKR
ncbi:hypothetical protein [[Eubacterium] cellulosolvens]